MIEEASSLVYLSSVIERDGGTEEDIGVRIGKAAAVFRRMGKFWACTKINLKAKLRLYNTIVLPTALIPK